MARYNTGIRAAVAAVAVVAAVLPASPAAAETMRQREWWLQTLHVAEAQRITTGTGIVVAVLDSGVQADHPDLAGRVLDGVRVTGDDDKGLVDHHDHGTGVAGLIAATGKGPTGGLGVAPGAKILPVTVYTEGIGGSDLAPAVRWAVDHGAKVINISQSYSQTLPEDEDAVRYALDHDVVVVAAAGNVEQGHSQVASPADIPGVIAVSATDRNGKFWSGSASGAQVALSAPGVDMAVLTRRTPTGAVGGYGLIPGGTSASAPIVAAAAALVRAQYPQLHAADVINRLIRTADDAGAPGRDPQYGFGRLNLLRALQADVPSVTTNPLGEPAAAARGPQAAKPSGVPRRALVVLVAALAVVLLLVLLTVVVIVLVVRRRRRRTSAPGGPGVPPRAPSKPAGR